MMKATEISTRRSSRAGIAEDRAAVPAETLTATVST